MADYRTKTYIAADWDNDEDAVKMLHYWNDSNHWSLHFHDAHELTQSRDSSLPCTIKSSLKTRLDASKTFVLIVGDSTNDITKGSCSYCGSYNSYTQHCAKGYAVDRRSYIKYECEKAAEAGIKIVVLYKSATVIKTKCPIALRNTGIHTAMKRRKTDGTMGWDYIAVKKALE